MRERHVLTRAPNSRFSIGRVFSLRTAATVASLPFFQAERRSKTYEGKDTILYPFPSSSAGVLSRPQPKKESAMSSEGRKLGLAHARRRATGTASNPRKLRFRTFRSRWT